MSNQNSNTYSKATSLEKLELTGSIPVIINQQVLDKIKALCRAIPKEEWSGVLFYIIEGTIKDIANVKIVVKDILLMDRGSSAYTEYEWNEDIVNYQCNNPESLDWIKGHIHSHNTMSVFFSGTDWSELNDNCPQHNIYFSLIVNNFMDMTAKVAFTAEAQHFTCKDEKGQNYTLAVKNNTASTMMFVYSCDIELPEKEIIVDEGFISRINSIKEKCDKRDATKLPVQTPVNKSGGYAPGYGSYTPGIREKQLPKEKRFEQGEMGFFPDSFDNYKSNYPDTEDDMTIEEKFIAYALNGGKHIKNIESLTDILDFLDRGKISGETIADKLIQSYGGHYENFFKNDKNYLKDDAKFLEVLESVIDILIEEEYYYPFLTPIITSLNQMGIKLENFLKDSTANNRVAHRSVRKH